MKKSATTYSMFQVDAFTSKVFYGNPAAVVPLADWISPVIMQKIAAENNLSETAFFTRADHDEVDFHLRWFTPKSEVDLCGHATLAAAHVLFHELDWYGEIIRFGTQKAGVLTVTKQLDGKLQLDFPSRSGKEINIFDALVEALGARPVQLLLARDHMAVFATEADVAALAPDMEKLAKINNVGIIATAPSEQSGTDFVSRFFVPAKGIPEDPVTGSSHCTLIPYWAERLKKTTLLARQISPRGGELECHYLSDKGRVTMAGHGVTFLTGTIFV
ncbi:MAG: PhzF family phenazine biosynthesis protein [Emcibacter sp.]|nr:PhzF family phenazine biosynthesis protein [Emcibacter sp.]